MRATIESGSSISHYRVLSPLGSGGMGEVYVARDTNLDRTVALKILPPQLTRSEERVRRFMQEARSASSLSHPHIVTIHEIGNAAVESEREDAPKSDPIHYIAMELIDGATLGAKIHRDRAELRTLLGYLQQAAEGLAKAHAAGIVHRDLKPDNIMVTSDGYAKILDFGLAKLQVRKDADASIDGATEVRADTRDGTVLGTVGYMSPEQVQGKQVDHRADIFSFGCILYEATTRQRPFRADSDVDVMHQILHDKPQPIEEVNPDAPAELRRIIRRCLAKEPDKRFQSMKDLALELGEIVDEFDTLPRSDDSKRAASSGSVSHAVLSIVPPRRWWLVATVVSLGVVLAGATYFLLRRGATSSAQPPATFLSMKMNRLTSSGNVTIAALSPDNRYLAHVVVDKGKTSLRVRQIATGADAEMVAPMPLIMRGVTFSPDGNYIYYTQAESETSGYSIEYQIPSLGGSPRKILFDVDTSVSFAPDGKRFTFVRGYPQFNESALMEGNIGGPGERKIAVRKGASAFPLLPAAWSPDGKKIAVIGTEGRDPELLVVDAATGAQQKVGDTKWFQLSGAAWLPDNSGIVLAAVDRSVSRQGQVWLVDYPSGKVRRITNDLNNYIGVSLTSDGKSLATIQSNAYSTLSVVSDGKSETPLTRGTQENAASSVIAMPEGTVMQVSIVDGRARISEIGLDGRRKDLQLGDDALITAISASSDGRTLLGVRLRDGVPHVVRMDRDGSNMVELTHGESENNVRISPDGSWFLYRTADNVVMRMPVGGGTAQQIATNVAGRPAISPDGKLVVVTRQEQEGGRALNYLVVYPATGGAPVGHFNIEGTTFVTFAPQGDAIDYVVPSGGVDNVWRQPLGGGPPKQLTSFKEGSIGSFAWLNEGKTLVLLRPATISDVVLISDYR